MKRHPIASDQRYSISYECTGQPKPMFVVRFCGDWIGQAQSYPQAVLIAVGAKNVRNGALIVTEQR